MSRTCNPQIVGNSYAAPFRELHASIILLKLSISYPNGYSLENPVDFEMFLGGFGESFCGSETHVLYLLPREGCDSCYRAGTVASSCSYNADLYDMRFLCTQRGGKRVDKVGVWMPMISLTHYGPEVAAH